MNLRPKSLKPISERCRKGILPGLALPVSVVTLALFSATLKPVFAADSGALFQTARPVSGYTLPISSAPSAPVSPLSPIAYDAPQSPHQLIRTNDALRIERGKPDIIVAVIDTGIDASHPSLSANIWRDPQSTNYGWNFVKNQPNPTDENGHGTHVAGIMTGIAQKISIMPIKYYSENNSGNQNLRNAIRAIYFAISHGAKIINYSGGGPSFSQEEYEAFQLAESRGILVVAAAGNDHHNTDLKENYYYPSAYRAFGLTNIITVAATDLENRLLPSSNWGKQYVDVTAPGERILSTLPANQFGRMTGTSQATAFVTGIAALILSHQPNLTPQQVRNVILSSVDFLPHLSPKIASGGRVNAYKALVILEQKFPRAKARVLSPVVSAPTALN